MNSSRLCSTGIQKTTSVVTEKVRPDRAPDFQVETFAIRSITRKSVLVRRWKCAPDLHAERAPSLQRSSRCQVRSIRLRELCRVACNVDVRHSTGYLLLRCRNVGHIREADEELYCLNLAC